MTNALIRQLRGSNTMRGRTSSPLLKTDDLMGVEFELENSPPNLIGERFDHGITAHVDGSLRNNGIELVTPPVSGDALVDAVAYICRIADHQKLRVSNRAGLHVHIDMTEVTAAQAINMILCYLLTEPLLMSYAQERINSIYTRPLYLSTLEEELKACIDGLRLGVLPAISTRYMALNINALSKFGTLEFRHLRSTKDADKVIEWINIIQCLKEYSMKNILTKDRVNNLDHHSFAKDIYGKYMTKFDSGAYESYFLYNCLPMANVAFFPVVEKTPPDWKWAPAPITKQINKGYAKFKSKIVVPPKPKNTKDAYIRNFIVQAQAEMAAPLNWNHIVLDDPMAHPPDAIYEDVGDEP